MIHACFMIGQSNMSERGYPAYAKEINNEHIDIQRNGCWPFQPRPPSPTACSTCFYRLIPAFR